MRAWLERVTPEGEPLSLPEGSGTLIFGRSPRSTVVFDDPQVSPRHCELHFEAGFWRLRDLGSEHGTRVNGAPVRFGRALFDGDLVQLGGTELTFRTDLPVDDEAWLSSIATDPDDEARWAVYADGLQERGDPLGERIVKSRASVRVDHMPWLGPLWEPFVAGELELDWHFGFIRRATLRFAAGRVALDWRAALSMLFALRVGRLIRELVVDLPRLEALTPVQLPDAVLGAQHTLAALPRLPMTLSKLSFGYHVAPATGSMTGLGVTEALAQRAPRLRGETVYQRAPGIRVRVMQKTPGTVLSGIEEVRTISAVTRLRRGQRNTVVLESPPGIPFMADGNPCYLSFADGRLQLMTGRMRGEVRVNHRIDSLFALLPGDVIEVQGSVRLKVELIS